MNQAILADTPDWEMDLEEEDLPENPIYRQVAADSLAAKDEAEDLS